MQNRTEKMNEFVKLLEKLVPEEGIVETGIDKLVLYRSSKTHKDKPQSYEPAIIIGAQGKKRIYIEGRKYEYGAGQFLTVLVPMPASCELIEASPEKPLLGLGMILDRDRLLKIFLKMDNLEAPAKKDHSNLSSIFSASIPDSLLDAVVRLLKTLHDPAETAVIGDAILDEIYFHIITGENGESLRQLLQQNGQIKQIARAVEHVHKNLDQIISVEVLAKLVNMSASGFHKKFKEVMHLSPLQYAKSIKLNKAHSYIVEGKSISEAGFLVGYNSPAQFSREYKRHFGVSPSQATEKLIN